MFEYLGLPTFDLVFIIFQFQTVFPRCSLFEG